MPEIPQTPFLFNNTIAGPDPTIEIQQGNTGTHGDKVSISASITDNAAGLLSADLIITYDTNQLSITPADITIANRKDDLLAGWSLFSRVDDTLGEIRLNLFHSTPHTGGVGEILKFNFAISHTAQAGITVIDLEGELNEGELTFTPIDGNLSVVAETPIFQAKKSLETRDTYFTTTNTTQPFKKSF